MKNIKHTLSWGFLNVLGILLFSKFFSFWVAVNICLGITVVFSILWEIYEHDDILKGLTYAFVGFILAGITLLNVWFGIFVLGIIFLSYFYNTWRER